MTEEDKKKELLLLEDDEAGDELPDVSKLPPGKPMLYRQATSLESAMREQHDSAMQSLQQQRKLQEESENEQALRHLHLPAELKGAVFVGHTATDLDSIASAIGAAELFGGVPARASDINSETRFALEYWKHTAPEPFAKVWAAAQSDKSNKARVCLVDHNQKSQLAEEVPLSHVVGVIDHHALQSGTIITDQPIYVLIRPWGSACTIVAHLFLSVAKPMSTVTAGLLLCGILSDTLNLCSPTTTNADRLIVTILAQLCKVQDVNSLARQMFRAKSQDLLSLGPHGLVRGDIKTFAFKGAHTDADGKPLTDLQIAFGVVETIAPEVVLELQQELLVELRAFKQERACQVAFLAVVDIQKMQSTLLLCGTGEKELAKKVFAGEIDGVVMSLGNRVSRKKDFLPPISTELSAGWHMPKEAIKELEDDSKEDFGHVVVHCTPHGCVVHRHHPKAKVAGLGVLATRFLLKGAHHHGDGHGHAHGHAHGDHSHAHDHSHSHGHGHGHDHAHGHADEGHQA